MAVSPTYSILTRGQSFRSLGLVKDLIIDICTTSPALAAHLSRNSGVLDAVIAGHFFDDWPGAEALQTELTGRHRLGVRSPVQLVGRDALRNSELRTGFFLVDVGIPTIEKGNGAVGSKITRRIPVPPSPSRRSTTATSKRI